VWFDVAGKTASIPSRAFFNSDDLRPMFHRLFYMGIIFGPMSRKGTRARKKAVER
jgi:hypothetical protein